MSFYVFINLMVVAPDGGSFDAWTISGPFAEVPVRWMVSLRVKAGPELYVEAESFEDAEVENLVTSFEAVRETDGDADAILDELRRRIALDATAAR